jgi:hypothetical protein
MNTELGVHPPNEFWARINSEAQAQRVGTVRLTSHIKYGQGYGIRFTDLTIEEAERLGVELIQTAQQAADLKAAHDAEKDRQVAITLAKAFPDGVAS